MKNQMIRMNPAQLFVPSGFCHAVQAPANGKLLFISGQVSYDEHGAVVGAGDIEVQTRRIFENLQIILDGAGASFDDIVKYTFYVKDMSAESIQAIRKVRAHYINAEALPSSTMIGVTALAKDELLLEVEAYAMQYGDSSPHTGIP